jgi:hypothetical protein
MSDSTVITLPEIEEISSTDGQDMLRHEVGDKLGLSLDDFLRKLDAGEYEGTEDDTILRLVTFVPYVR